MPPGQAWSRLAWSLLCHAPSPATGRQGDFGAFHQLGGGLGRVGQGLQLLESKVRRDPSAPSEPPQEAVHLICPTTVRFFCPRVQRLQESSFSLAVQLSTFWTPLAPTSRALQPNTPTLRPPSLPSPSSPIVAPRPGVASFQSPGPCADSPERLPGPDRGFGDRGGAPGRKCSRAPTPTR